MVRYTGRVKKYLVWWLVTPVFWWMVTRPGAVAFEWRRVPGYARTYLQELTGPERLGRINEMRGAGGKWGRVWFNKGYVVVDEIFSVLSLLSPRIYFQAGDGGPLSPPGVEPIPGLLVIFWAGVMVASLKKYNPRPFVIAGLGAVGAYAVGGIRLAFLLPVLGVYLYWVEEGATMMLGRKRKWLVAGTGIICAYLAGRAYFLD